MTNPDWTTILVPLVLFLATVIRSTFGFGEALIAVPLLALLIPVEVAAPVAMLVSVTVAMIAIAQDWREIHVRSAGRLVLATAFGIPLGLLLLKTVSEPVVKAFLGIVIVAFSTYSLSSAKRHEIHSDYLSWMFGFSAGVLGGAYGMNGPPLVIYGSLRGWSPTRFRATLQGYFLPASAIGMCGYWLTGLWTPAVTRFYFVSLPGILIATFLGRVINQRLSAGQFLVYIHLGLIIIGSILLAQAML
ncbi:MAG TPA: sulfite exporter TauE/SafE family protein [Bryobacteraceae bacterium]|nr:sulfite exporter TauE/SafE family protein [Bryobacteraceae bacterium]